MSKVRTMVAQGDFETLAAVVMAQAPGMPYAAAERIALAVVMEDAIPGRWVRVKEDGLRLRVYPGTERNGEAVEVVQMLAADMRAQVWRIGEGAYAGWTAITLRSGRQVMGGWVASQFLEDV